MMRSKNRTDDGICARCRHQSLSNLIRVGLINPIIFENFVGCGKVRVRHNGRKKTTQNRKGIR
jgi:hypothetical protein